MTSSDQPLSNSPKCETCGLPIVWEEQMRDGADWRHIDWPQDHVPVLPHQPAPLSNSEGGMGVCDQCGKPAVIAIERNGKRIRQCLEHAQEPSIETKLLNAIDLTMSYEDARKALYARMTWRGSIGASAALAIAHFEKAVESRPISYCSAACTHDAVTPTGMRTPDGRGIYDCQACNSCVVLIDTIAAASAITPQAAPVQVGEQLPSGITLTQEIADAEDAFLALDVAPRPEGGEEALAQAERALVEHFGAFYDSHLANDPAAVLLAHLELVEAVEAAVRAEVEAKYAALIEAAKEYARWQQAYVDATNMRRRWTTAEGRAIADELRKAESRLNLAARDTLALSEPSIGLDT